jgi:PhzF family phenazine biosynthesis protein
MSAVVAAAAIGVLCALRQRARRKINIQFAEMFGFCSARGGGNAAGVVLPEESAKLNEDQKRRVASLLGYSETLFLSPLTWVDGKPVLRVEYVTPEGEVDLCGHATIASLGYLLRTKFFGSGAGSSGGILQTRAGAVQWWSKPGIFAHSGTMWMEQIAPVFGEEISPSPQLEEALGLTSAELGITPCIVSTGLRDLMVEVKSLESLKRMRPNMGALSKLSMELDVVGAHVFCRETIEPTNQACCRNFAPRFGIDEESATGTSNCALACLLHKKDIIRRPNYIFEQGDFMGMSSRVEVRLPQCRFCPLTVCLYSASSLPLDCMPLLSLLSTP